MRPTPSTITADLLPEWAQLQADVDAWCAAMLPCLVLGCSHPLADHGPSGDACGRCDCWAYMGRPGQVLAPVRVTVGRSLADDTPDRPATGQEHTP